MGTARTVFVATLLAFALVAASGLAAAEKGGSSPAAGKSKATSHASPPSHATAKGLAAKAIEPPASVAPTPTSAPSSAPQQTRGASSPDAGAQGGAALSDASASAPTPPTRAERVDLLFGAPGTAAVSGPTIVPGIGAPGERGSGPSGAPWWLALLWALPLVGVGGAGTVLLLRRKHASTLVTPRRARPGAMAPVEPSDVDGLLRNGQAAVARGAIDEAVRWFDAALRISPTLAVAHFCKGVCLAANGRVAEAYGALDEAVYAAPDDASYRIHFARAALALGRPNDALDALALVAREMPDLGPAMLEDPQLAALRDDPRFLMLCGEL